MSDKYKSTNALFKLNPIYINRREKYHLHIEEYENGNIALLLLDDQNLPYMKCTVNYENYKLEDDQVLIKNWSENKGILDILIKNNIVKYIKKVKVSQFVEADLCEFLL